MWLGLCQVFNWSSQVLSWMLPSHEGECLSAAGWRCWKYYNYWQSSPEWRSWAGKLANPRGRGRSLGPELTENDIFTNLLGAVLVCGVKLQKSSTFLFLLSELVLVFWAWTWFRSILTVGHWVYLWLVTCDAEQNWLLLSDSLWSSSTFEQLDVEGSSSEMENIKTTLILRDVGLVFWYW